MTDLFQDHQREKELLKRFLFYPQDQYALTGLNPSLFDNVVNQQVFTVIKKMYEKHYVITPVTTVDFIKNHATSKENNSEQLIEAIFAFPDSSVSAIEHIPHLTDIYYRRKFNNLIRRSAEMLTNKNAPLESIIHYISNEVAGFEKVVEAVDIVELAERVKQNIILAQTQQSRIIKSGLRCVDESIGFMPGTQMLIIGKSGEGKSTLLNQLILNFLQNNTNVAILYFSMEISEEKLIENFVSNLTNTTKDMLRGKSPIKLSETELQTIAECIELIKTFNIEILYGAKNDSEIALAIDVFASKNRDKQLVFALDHHLYIKDDINDMQKSINRVSKVLVDRKERYQALSILLCQLHFKHTEDEDSSGRKIPPDAKHVKYLGDLYQDADTTMAIWRKNKIDLGQDFTTEQEVVELYIQKQREGQPEILLPVIFTGKYGQWHDVQSATYMDNPDLMADLAAKNNQVPDFDY